MAEMPRRTHSVSDDKQRFRPPVRLSSRIRKARQRLVQDVDLQCAFLACPRLHVRFPPESGCLGLSRPRRLRANTGSPSSMEVEACASMIGLGHREEAHEVSELRGRDKGGE